MLTEEQKRQRIGEILEELQPVLERMKRGEATAEEREQFHRGMDQAEALAAEVGIQAPGSATLAERHKTLDGLMGQPTGTIAGGRQNGPAIDDPDGGAAGAQGEYTYRALRPDESLYRHLEGLGRFEGQDDYRRQVGFARYVRAMVLGPQNEAERRALSEGSDSAGGYTVPTFLSSELIDKLRARSVAIRAGSRTVALQSNEHHFAKIVSDPQPAWRGENQPVAEAEPTFKRVAFRPKALAMLTKASREVLEDSVNLEEAINRVFAASMALEVDRVVLMGSGTDPEPLGITGTPGVHELAHGAALSGYTPLLGARRELLTANVMEPGNGFPFIMHPRSDYDLASLTDTTDQPLRTPPALENARFLLTTQLPVDEGTNSDETRIITGNFADSWIGFRGSELRIEVLRETFAENLQYGFLVWLRMDWQAAHAESFAQLTGIVPPPEA